ncbi:MAG: radical SAM protein [Bacteroidia bacterium]|nr:radical SAM protein [Bacteroidia bacterium]
MKASRIRSTTNSRPQNFKKKYKDTKPVYAPPLVKGIEYFFVGFLMRMHVILIAIRSLKDLSKIHYVISELIKLRKAYSGDFEISKLFKVDGKYYWDKNVPAWPSRAFVIYNESEINRIVPFRKNSDYLNSLIIDITNKCPLSCEHCFNWDTLNTSDRLSCDELKEIIQKFQQKGRGVAQIHFSGGEPMARFKDLLSLLKSAEKSTDLWLLTSGFGLTMEKIQLLKSAGLSGINISLDHFDPEKHNAFRGSEYAFKWVENAVELAHKIKLPIVLTVCATPEFTNEKNFLEYAELAKKFGVSFIQILEAKSVGRYASKDTSLSTGQVEALEEFFLKVNYSDEFEEYPAVSYYGYHQRRAGCYGGSSRYLYVDSDGTVNTCPFCRTKYSNVLHPGFDDELEKIQNKACHSFPDAELKTVAYESID